MKSLDTMVKQCAGLVDTKDVTQWENGFLTHVVAVVEARGADALTANQAACIEQLYNKHFAGLDLDSGCDAVITWP